MLQFVPIAPVPPAELDGRTRRAPATPEEAKAMLLADRGYMLWSVIRNAYAAVVQRAQAMGVEDVSAGNLYRLALAMEPEEQAELLGVPWNYGRDSILDPAVGELIAKAERGVGSNSQRFPVMVIPAALLGASNYFQQAAANDEAEAAQEMAEAKERSDAIIAEARSAQRAAAWAEWRKKYGWTLWVAAAAGVVLLLLLIRYLRNR